MRSDRTRLYHHIIALLLVAASVSLRTLIGGNDPAVAFLLVTAAIAAAAWHGGVSAGIVATLAALLAARVLSHVDPIASILFLAEGGAIVWLAAHASHAVSVAASAVAAADIRIRELLAAQRRLRRIDAAAARLEQLAPECAALVVDEHGQIVEWREGAARLFGWTAEGISRQSVAQLFAAGADTPLEHLLAGATPDTSPRMERRCIRADGTAFSAHVEIHRVPDTPPAAYVVTVRDRTREEEWDAFADASADLQATLREEADAAHRQLATLQYVTDPALNLLPASQAITALLDRLRGAIEVDGVAVIRSGRPRRPLFAASDGLKPDTAGERRQGEVRPLQAGRILIVQNDPARVQAASAAGWCDEASSLIAVPIVSGSRVEGTVEAVRLKSRRSTEWEIALVQVVAAQIAGRLQNESMFGADAVA
jgi:PAS domain S-box-containing protein